MSIASEGVDGLAYFAGGILGGMAGAAFVKSMGNRMNAVKEGQSVTKSMSGAGAKRGTVTRKRLSLIKRRTIQNMSSSSQSASNSQIDKKRSIGFSLDLFAFVELDSVTATGGEVSFGIVIDIDHPGESGIFISGGDGDGLNIGGALGAGFVFGDIEGSSFTIDINAKLVSPTFIFNDSGFNGMALSYGPGLGCSVARPKTWTYTINDFLKMFD